MKPLDLKLEWIQQKGLRAEQHGDLVYIWDVDGINKRVLILHGNPTYRRLREGLRTWFRNRRWWYG